MTKKRRSTGKKPGAPKSNENAKKDESQHKTERFTVSGTESQSSDWQEAKAASDCKNMSDWFAYAADEAAKRFKRKSKKK